MTKRCHLEQPYHSHRPLGFLCIALLAASLHGQAPASSSALTWTDIKTRFEANNTDLKADADAVDELRAQEITAFLRPNPNASFTLDQTYPFGKHYDPNVGQSVYRPLSDALTTGSVSYLWERRHKRYLRRDSAAAGVRVGESMHADLERNLIFNLRSAFVQVLQAKRVLDLAREDVAYYDHIIRISKDRLDTGDIAQVDYERIELLRVQYEAEIESATVNLRTQKIQLLHLMDDRTPVDAFDVRGEFGFADGLLPLDELRQDALSARPDLQAATQTVEQAKINHQLAVANGSTDPTIGVDSGSNPPLGPYLGLNVQIPLRIFDRNQGEKRRTQIDIDRSQQLQSSATTQVFADVDSAYEQVRSAQTLLKPYRDKYTGEAKHVRDTIEFSYMHGGASLLDFLSAENDYRQLQLSYTQLIGTYMVAVGQLNLAVGREVMP